MIVWQKKLIFTDQCSRSVRSCSKKSKKWSDLCVKAAHTAPSLPYLASLSITPILTTLTHFQDLSVIWGTRSSPDIGSSPLLSHSKNMGDIGSSRQGPNKAPVFCFPVEQKTVNQFPMIICTDRETVTNWMNFIFYFHSFSLTVN